MKKRILVIDDEAPIRDLMLKILGRAGYSVFTAPDGLEALKLLENTKVDLIMLDMNMPNMNGIEFLKHIRTHKITNKPVLMVSGSHDTEHRIESYKLGAYDFITKPEQTEVMLKRVENGLKIGELIDFNDFMRVELFMAKKLQKYIFPESRFNTVKTSISSWSSPLADIGGDLYDYIHFRDGRIIFFIADVSGHSISASMFTTIVKMVFRNALQKTEVPGELMTIANTELSQNLPTEAFVTMFCGLIDENEGTLFYSNAGHPPPKLIRNGKMTDLQCPDPFLGPIEGTEYVTIKQELQNGDTIFLYTDGLLDIIDEVYKHVDADRIMELFLGYDCDFDRFIQEISGQKYIRSDDCTVMVINRNE